MAIISTSDIKDSRDSLSNDPVAAAFGGASAGHVVAHAIVATCGAPCLPFIALGALIFGGIAALKKK